MVAVTADQIRKRLGLTESDITDEDVIMFRDGAAAYLSEETGEAINASECTTAEANAVANLAAIYCYLKVTGAGSAGWTVNLGQLTFHGSAEKIAQLEFLKQQVREFIHRKRRVGISLLEGP
jgi:hypothetical protein